jgi:hypothetical protein
MILVFSTPAIQPFHDKLTAAGVKDVCGGAEPLTPVSFPDIMSVDITKLFMI